MGFAQRLDSDGEGLGSYDDHDMTRLDGSRTEEDRRIVSLNGLLNQVENHLLGRINLQELYSVLCSHAKECAQRRQLWAIQLRPGAPSSVVFGSSWATREAYLSPHGVQGLY